MADTGETDAIPAINASDSGVAKKMGLSPAAVTELETGGHGVNDGVPCGGGAGSARIQNPTPPRGIND